MRIVLCILLGLSGLLNGQTSTQNIRGTVIDKDTRQPLIAATVSLLNADPMIGTTTDLDGRFLLENVKLGRQQVEVSYVGYGSFISEIFILTSAKEVFLEIEILESGITAEEITITAFKHSNVPLNELSVVSTRSFSVEETQRYAASANDPGRMSMGFPGVQPSRDSRSDIVVRGNSGIGLLWRLEGIDIPNPNHFARRGSSGGGITVFSVSMLGNSDFSSAAFPAEYGNAFSGVFDIKLRNGSRENRSYTFRAGMLGLDLATEGPIKKGKSSYLINYRYSTLGLLNQLGIYLVNPRADNLFQDLSFKLSFNGNTKSTFSIWGIGGLSDEFERAVDDLDAQSTYAEKLTRDFQSNMGAIGMTHTWLLNDKSYVKSALAVSGQDISFVNDTLNIDREATLVNSERYKTSRYTLTSFYNNKINSKVNLKTGLYLHNIRYDLLSFKPNDVLNETEGKGDTYLLQPYVQFRFNPSEKLNINVGVHAMFLTLNNTNSIEPRFSVKYDFTSRTNLSFAYGLHSRMLPIGNYFYPGEVFSSIAFPNLDLELIKSHHFVLAFDHFFTENWKVHTELYYQHLYDVPVGLAFEGTYSLLNIIDGYATQALVSEGKGTNLGIDISIEKTFSNGSFLLTSASIFDSKYEMADGRRYNGRYNSNFSASLMAGKEWSFEKNNSLTLSGKFLYNLGARITPLRPGVDEDGSEPPFDFTRPFEERVKPYIRPDIRIAYRKSREKTAWTLSLDVQNIISRRNQDALDRIFDIDTGVWIDRVQSGLTPVLSYQLEF